MDSKTAALNSLYVILFSQGASLLTTFARGNVPDFQWPMLIAMVIGGVLGGNLTSPPIFYCYTKQRYRL